MTMRRPAFYLIFQSLVQTPLPNPTSGAFLIPYLIFLFTCGVPVFFLETALGQYTSQGGITCWRKISPLFEGMAVKKYFLLEQNVPTIFFFILHWIYKMLVVHSVHAVRKTLHFQAARLDLALLNRPWVTKTNHAWSARSILFIIYSIKLRGFEDVWVLESPFGLAVGCPVYL